MRTIRTSLLAIVFLVNLNLGIVMAFDISVSKVRIAIEAMILLLLAITAFRSSRADVFRALKWIGLPLLAASIGIAGDLSYQASHLEMILFARESLMPLVFFALFLLEPPDKIQWRVLLTVLLLTAAIQLPVAALKYCLLGVNEKQWIGTFHQTAGQLGLLMPMLTVVFLWAYAIKRGCLFVPVLLATGYALVSVVNEKRAVVFILPLLVALLISIDLIASRLSGRQLREIWYCKKLGTCRLLSFYLLSVVAVIAFALHNISSFDTSTGDYENLPHRSVIAYSIEYLNRDYDSPMNRSANPDLETNRNIQMGRFRLWARGIETVAELPLARLLFGAGGGWLLEHPLLTHKPNDIFFDRIQLRGPTSTGLRHLFEIGIVGFLLMFIWLGQIAWALLRRVSDGGSGMIALGAAGAWAIFMFDYLFYSQVGSGVGVFAPVCFLFVAVALRGHDALK